jgi:glycolate oxidase FAD binding subunit
LILAEAARLRQNQQKIYTKIFLFPLIQPMSKIATKLESLLNAEAVVGWDALELNFKAQIQRAVSSPVDCVAYPTTVAELSEVVACAYANRWKMLPCGSGSKLHWGAIGSADLVVSTARLNRLIEFASGDLTITAEAGMRLADLQTRASEAKQFLAVDPAYATEATLGGIVATADTGAMRQRYSGVRDLLIGLTLVRSDGKIAKAGGRVVKNVAGYDLMKLLTGSYGSLGILAQLTFRMHPVPAASRSLLVIGDAVKLTQVTATLVASALTPTAIEILAGVPLQELARNAAELGLLVRFQSIEISVEQQAQQLMQLAQQFGLEAKLIDESTLWQQLRIAIDAQPPEAGITCKIGIEPAKAVMTLDKISDSILASIIHAGSGLGTIRLPLLSVEAFLQLRQLCQTQGGFLTVLSAPASFKQQLDVWGYPGPALDLMRRLKTQFDPENLLSPQRFVGQI